MRRHFQGLHEAGESATNNVRDGLLLVRVLRAAGCGAVTKRGQHCPKCGRQISGNKLIELAKLGRQVAQSPKSQQNRSETQRRHEAAKRDWNSSPRSDWPDEKVYVEQIQPRLAGVTISDSPRHLAFLNRMRLISGRADGNHINVTGRFWLNWLKFSLFKPKSFDVKTLAFDTKIRLTM